MEDCYACRTGAMPDPPWRERVLVTGGWRVAHTFDSALLGWLVVLPRRHVLAIDELTEAEALELGPLVHRLSRALRDELGCTKTYLMQFS